MKHIFGFFIVCVIVILGIFSLKSLILGWPEKLDPSKYDLVLSTFGSGNGVNCDELTVTKSDVVNSGNLLTSKNYNFTFQIPGGMKLTKTEGPFGGTPMFSFESENRLIILSILKSTEACYRDLIGLLTDIYSSKSSLVKFIKEDRSKEVIKTLGTDEFTLLNYAQYKNGQNTVFENTRSVYVKRLEGNFFYSLFTILHPDGRIFNISASSGDVPLLEEERANIINSLKIN